ncbi:hypothetical protein KJ608_03130 [Patescibacteria group bacterium]|nr:hypothetical protein [Patescibacteria group bacterium]
MKKNWGLIPMIKSGRKVAESRWYKLRVAPWNRIEKGDTVYFKNSGESVTLKAKVSRVLQYVISNGSERLKIIKKHAKKDLGLDEIPEEIQNYISNKRYAIFVFIENPEEVEPFDIDKSGFGKQCAWVTVLDIEKIKK